MIGAPLLLLVGLSDPSGTEGDLNAHAVAAASRPAPSPTAVARIRKKEERRLRAVRRSQRNDITETLRAMNMMNVGLAPLPEQRSGPNQ